MSETGHEEGLPHRRENPISKLKNAITRRGSKPETRPFPNYWSSAEAMHAAISEYTSRERFGTPELALHASVDIPTLTGMVRFTKENDQWRTARGSAEYDSTLFGDEFVLVPSLGREAPTSRPRSTDARNNGERDYAFRPGNTVVDLGSGEAVALLEYAQKYPDTSFIGVDLGYDNTNPPVSGAAGVQLVKDDWSVLETIPDHSVDTILSSKGVYRWGLDSDDPQAIDRIVAAQTRIAKPNAVIRYDLLPDERQQFLTVERKLEERGWQVTRTENTTIALNSRR